MLEDNKDGRDLDMAQVLQNSYDYDDKALRVVPLGSMVPKDFDYIGTTGTDSTHDVYQYFTGGAGGTLIATVTITYTDSSKNTLVSIART